jgi:hypothetical protein
MAEISRLTTESYDEESGSVAVIYPDGSLAAMACNNITHQVRATEHAHLFAAAPDLLAACKLGDSLGNDGPFLLRYVAELIDGFAPITAEELHRKAEAEEAAIAQAQGVLDV